MQTEFFRQRHLTQPVQQLRPASVEELTETISALEADGRTWRLIGDGQHATDLPGGDYTAVRTDELDAILDVDATSGTVQVEAGIRWSELAAALGEEGFSLQRYGLHPASATVGGLLARHRPAPTLLRGGDLLDGCIAVGAFHPESGDYRYITAPRKASGPDLRHLFVGAGHSDGVIVDATLVVWRPTNARLIRYDDVSPADAAGAVETMFAASITPAWVHYGWKSRTLQFEIAAPGQLLRARVEWLKTRLGAPDDIGDREDARTRKQWLQARHPHRRSHPDADKMRIFWVALSALGDDPTELFGDGVEDVEIPMFTPRRATAFVTYKQPEMVDERADAVPQEALWATHQLTN